MECRILPEQAADGPGNLGLDEALLDAVDADPSRAYLRFYTWNPPTLSLGYFQRWEDATREERWRDVSLVRRPSGGGAIWHDRDLTYALVVPRALPAAVRPADLYRAVHRTIAGVLRSVGIDARRRADVPEASGPLAGPTPLLCFLDRDPEDILIGTTKVVGSAQRRRPHAVLQHGSILLEASPRTPELPGLRELAGRTEPAHAWSEALQTVLPEALGLVPVPAGRDATLGPVAERLATEVYRNPAWIRRR